MRKGSTYTSRRGRVIRVLTERHLTEGQRFNDRLDAFIAIIEIEESFPLCVLSDRERRAIPEPLHRMQEGLIDGIGAFMARKSPPPITDDGDDGE